MASNLLNLSDHFSSSCTILESTVELLAVDLTVLDVDAFSFFAFFSGGATDFTVPCLSTAPNTATTDGSTRDSVSLDGVDSSFLASRLSFLFYMKA